MPALPLLAAVLLVLSVVNADHFPPWSSFHAEAPAFAASAVLLFAALAGRPRLRLPPAIWLLLALLVTVWIQLATGLMTYAGDAWVASAYLVAFGAAWLWGYGAGTSKRPQQVLFLVCWTLVAMGILASGQALAQWLQVGAALNGWIFDAAVLRPAGNFGQPNLTATLLLMATASTAVLLVQARLKRPVAWMLLVLFGWVVVLTQSRTALLSAAVLAAVALLLAVRHERLKPYRVDVLLWVALMVFGVLLVQNVQWDFSVTSRKAEDLAQVGNRMIIWRQVLAGVLESPWIGHGWVQIAGAQQAGALQVPGQDQVNYAHNAVLDLMVFIGIPGALLVIGISLAWFASRLKRLGTVDPGAGAGLLLLIPFLLHMQLELPHANAFFLLPVGMLLGSFDAQTEPVGARAWHVPRPALAAVCVAWVAVLGAVGYEYMLVEEDFRVNRFENQRLGTTPADYQVPELHLLTQWGETMQAMRLRAKPRMKVEDLDLLVRTSNRFSWAPLHYRTALSLGLNGRPAEAGHQLRVIKAMFPAETYAQGKADWIRLREEQHSQLRGVELP